jgi:hypothetical protein
MTAALVGFLGGVGGLAVGFGYRFWSTRRDELMAATIATTLRRDASLAAHKPLGDIALLAALWDDHRIALIKLITPGDYEVLSRSIEPASPDGARVAAVFRGLTMLFGVNTKRSS